MNLRSSLDLHLNSIFVAALNKLGHTQLVPRTPASLGLLGAYDGNVIGGSLLGIGMALAGSCPGTVLAQVGAGVRSGFFALDGAVLGGIAYAGIRRFPGIVRFRAPEQRTNGEKSPNPITVHDILGISRTEAVAGFLAVAAVVIASTALLAPSSPYAKIYPALGGLLVGLVQLFSILSRKALIGSSSAFQETGDAFWWLLGAASSDKSAQRSYKNILFAFGMVAGAFTISRLAPTLLTPVDLDVSPVLATAGGFLMILGSRIAGGCTSGHGISGISALSISSFVTIAVAFGVGAIVAPFVY